jgi:HNH endonuclease
MQTSKNLKLHVGERIELLPFKKSPNGHRYAITNHGRIISHLDTPKKGIFLKIGKISNYPGISISIGQAKKSFLVHRLVAQSFLKQSSKQHKFVLHLNYNKDDNHYKNLKWATREQQGIHYRNNPIEKIGNKTLTKEKVRTIKQKLQAGKTTLKALAKKFGVSDMQIHRIKTGENWGHIKI